MISCLILGGGINGLLSALMLRQAGQEVSVLERNSTGRESSWAGAGILSLLPPWNYGPEVNALAKLGRALWPELAERLRLAGGVDPEYLRCGMLVLEPEHRELALNWCEQQGETVATPPASLARFRAPDSLWLPNVAQARNPRIMQALYVAASRAGVRIHEHTPATQLLIEGTRVIGVATPGGVLAADNVLVTAGAWSGGLLAPLEHAPDIAPVRGQIVLLKAEPGLLPCVIYRRGHYLVPRADGLILVGSTLEEVGFDRSTTARARTELLDFAYGVMPELRQAEIVTQWSGLRPGAPYNIPTIGRHPSLENLYVNSGHFRYGVTMAPAAAEILSHHMTGTATTVDVTPYAWRAR
ncbi:MAG: FAD-dependent oxidoreductase [Pseudomonadota bacterium]|nr:FAD-dependent oxidoreductase [Pseudomonadota bacterium]MDP1902840.1 FAD-dependent oxidoreductase [Pseudomonadota bacterium]MDP2352846.1 FAD-dependent oxidoreductase [Pseudomonadota bacterium]